jgi:xanthine dehydrogenase accessory factor
MNPRTLALAAELARRREPFVLATVVWRRGPTSGKPGATALILADGTVRGWLGGACAEPTVVREARQALQSGQPALLVMGPTSDEVVPPGARAVPMACSNEGTMEVYVEPMLPPPHVVVVGRSPAADTLATLGAGLGWAATIVDDGGIGVDHPEGIPVVASLDFSKVEGLDDRTCIVVATQGHYDEDALEAALATEAAYVGLVASRARSQEVFGLLEDRGVPRAALDRVHAPAGMDLGPLDHAEIAVAVLAELVAERAAGRLGPAADTVAPDPQRTDPDPTDAIDPICGMTVDPATTHHRLDRDGQTYYFCSAGCLHQFRARTDPTGLP